MKKSLTTVAIVYTVVVLLLFLAPLIWKSQAGGIDHAKLTEEWLKGAFEFVKIGVAFLIGTVVWSKHQRVVEDERRAAALARSSSRWERVRTNMDAAAVSLAKAIRRQNEAAFDRALNPFRMAYAACVAYAEVLQDAGAAVAGIELLEKVSSYERHSLVVFGRLVDNLNDDQLDWTVNYESFVREYPAFVLLEDWIEA